ncbi:hypothetical protein CAL7102_09218 [Dulcicalothrix desertica PCC 7102]|nr:hypothetical protein CAL7102_09218 [Dulcicalothrix desertica PCC 7102]
MFWVSLSLNLVMPVSAKRACLTIVSLSVSIPVILETSNLALSYKFIGVWAMVAWFTGTVTHITSTVRIKNVGNRLYFGNDMFLV